MLDTYEFIKAMKAAGFPEVQAEAMAEQFKKSQESSLANLATKQDVHDLRRDFKEIELRFDTKLESMRGEITLLKWMMGFVLAGVLSLVMKAFFV